MKSFFRACRDGDFKNAKLFSKENLLQKNLLNRQDRVHGRNCLLWAIYHGDIEAVKYLVTFDQLDFTVADHDGRTALATAIEPKQSLKTHVINENGLTHHLYSPDDTMAMLKTLSKVNKELINRCTDFHDSPLQYAVRSQSLQVVKELVKLGADVNNRNKERVSILSVAATHLRLDIIRYLLNETDCDPYALDLDGYLPCSYFMIVLIDNAITSEVHFEFGLDFMSRSHKTQLAESFQVHRVLLYFYCCKNNEIKWPIARVKFPQIVNFVVVNNRRENLVQKLLAPGLEETFGLILLLFLGNFLQDLNDYASHDEETRFARMYFEELKVSFLEDLFPLFLKDEELANEYVAEITRLGYKFCYSGIICKLFISTPENRPDDVIRSFAKMLLRHGFDILGTVETETFSKSRMCQHIEFARHPEIILLQQNDCVNASVESENWLLDYFRLFDEEEDKSEVWSLQNLSRLSLRRYAFQNHRQGASTFLNSLNLPNWMKRFLTFN